ncbi:MAG: hypothetical protein JNN05_02200 [Candidatus Omnitrophica bacterium]|nr:hypothetical protein [Candidatus Omnitrophota bacterium]
MLAVLILIVAVATRYVDHSPNFTPTIALALFGGFYLPRKLAVLVPLAFMLFSDLMLGFHNTMFFTWGSVLMISMIGLQLRSNNKFSTFIFATVGSAVLFFIITNLGAWPTLYPVTWQGLTECFVAAIPFFRNTFVSAILYSTILYFTYAFLASRLKTSPRASLWLAA